jgi:glycosyltransferase involved in cell wall biosynthesis
MTVPVKVLYVTHTAARGGCASSLRYLLENLPDGSVDATVISPEGPALAAFRAAGARVIVVPGVSMFQSIHGIQLRGWRLLELLRTAWFMRYGAPIRRAIRELRPDLVHLNERGMIQAARIAFREGVPVVMHARSMLDRRTRWVKAITDRALNRYASVIVPIDESVSWSFREVARRRVIYNPLNVRVDRVAAPAAPVDAGPVRVTYLSGLLGFKGIWDLLEAARILRARQDVVFQIAGANSRPASFLRSPFGRLVQAAGLARDVEGDVREWLAGERITNVRMLGHVDDVAALLAATDILAFPSHLNATGRSVFEAGIYGIPSVVTMEDRIEDIVEDGVTGLIAPPHDPPRLAAAIERLASDRTLRLALGDAARRKYVTQFEPRRIGAETLDLYRAVLSGAPVAGSTPEPA